MIQYMNLLDSKFIAEADPAYAKNINKPKLGTSLIFRYGALAASFVLIIGVLFTMPYLPNDDLVSTDQTDNTQESTGPLDDTSDYGQESTGPIEDTSDHSSVSTDTDPGTDEPIVGVGGSKYCDHDVVYNHGVQDGSFHTIPGTLIEYVGQDEFSKWVEKKTEDMLASNEGKYDSCFVSIVDFVNDFNIPRRDFEVINDNFLADYYDYNLDAIYAGKEEAEAYYLSDRKQIILEKRFIRFFKSQLRLYVQNQDATTITNWIEEKNATEWGFSEATRSHIDIPGCGYSDEFRGGYSQYSIKEFIDYFDIPRDVVEEIYLRCQNPAFEGELDIEALFSTESSDSGSNNSDRTDKKPLEVDRSYIVY